MGKRYWTWKRGFSSLLLKSSDAFNLPLNLTLKRKIQLEAPNREVVENETNWQKRPN